MSAPGYQVRVVLDRTFGRRLEHLPAGEPVWVIESADNTAAARRLWAQRPGVNHLQGITTFHDCGGSPEEELMEVIDTIDLHHGVYSANPPFSEVEVIGAGLSPAVEQAFRRLGLSHFRPTPDGFLSSR